MIDTIFFDCYHFASLINIFLFLSYAAQNVACNGNYVKLEQFLKPTKLHHTQAGRSHFLLSEASLTKCQPLVIKYHSKGLLY